MLDADAVATELESEADGIVAGRRRKAVSPLRGLRGVSVATVTRTIARLWKKPGVQLPRDSDTLHTMFCTAHEDGLVAIGLIAPLASREPEEVLDLVDRWWGMIDDVETADAIGWMLLGPALLAGGDDFRTDLRRRFGEGKPHQRRAAVAATLSALPVPLEGPCAAALREEQGQRRIAFVQEPLSDLLVPFFERAIRDPDPHVRKGVARSLRGWAEADADRAEAWLAGVDGGVAKVLRDAMTRGIRRARRPVRTRSFDD